MNIPIDMRIDATTRSMTKKGIKITKPIKKALCTSERTKAGITVVIGSAAAFFALSCAAEENSTASSDHAGRSIQFFSGPSAALMA